MASSLKRGKALKYAGYKYDTICTDDCYLFGFGSRPVFDLEPIRAGPVEMAPGDILVAVGGNKTSAGFIKIWFDPGHGMRYVGSINSIDGNTAVMFEQIKPGKVINSGAGYRWLYYGWLVIDTKTWVFSTSARSGRIVELSGIRLIKKDGLK